MCVKASYAINSHEVCCGGFFKCGPDCSLIPRPALPTPVVNLQYGKEETCLFKLIDRQQVDVRLFYQNVLEIRNKIISIIQCSLFVPTHWHEFEKFVMET